MSFLKYKLYQWYSMSVKRNGTELNQSKKPHLLLI